MPPPLASSSGAAPPAFVPLPGSAAAPKSCTTRRQAGGGSRAIRVAFSSGGWQSEGLLFVRKIACRRYKVYRKWHEHWRQPQLNISAGLTVRPALMHRWRDSSSPEAEPDSPEAEWHFRSVVSTSSQVIRRAHGRSANQVGQRRQPRHGC